MKTTTKLNLGTAILLIGLAFWILETSLFLGMYGWHMKATQTPEIICDFISQLLFLAGWVLIILAALDVVSTYAPTVDKIRSAKKLLKKIDGLLNNIKESQKGCEHEYEKQYDGNDFYTKCGHIIENPQSCQE